MTQLAQLVGLTTIGMPVSGLVGLGKSDAAVADAYELHRGPLFRRLVTMTREPATAEDITQESFLRLTTEIQAGRAPDNIGAWLHRVAANLVASRGRRASVADRRMGDLVDRRIEPSPEAVSIHAEERRALRTALEALTPTDRQALLLAAHGYRGPEIARRLGRTEGATRTLLCRARTRLRERLQAAGVGP
jgi:RNA polymerase sigma-70 factor (ECF subfamily)